MSPPEADNGKDGQAEQLVVAPGSPRFLVSSEDLAGDMDGMENSDAQPVSFVTGPCPNSPQPRAPTKEDWEKRQAELAKLEQPRGRVSSAPAKETVVADDVDATTTQAAGAQRGGRAQRAFFSVGN